MANLGTLKGYLAEMEYGLFRVGSIIVVEKSDEFGASRPGRAGVAS